MTYALQECGVSRTEDLVKEVAQQISHLFPVPNADKVVWIEIWIILRKSSMEDPLKEVIFSINITRQRERRIGILLDS